MDWTLIEADVVQVEKQQDKPAIDALMARHGYARRRDARLQDTIYVRRGFVPRARPWWSIRCLPEC